MKDRILLLGGVGVVKGRIKGAGRIMVELCDELDPIIKQSEFYKQAPFELLNGIIRFGTKDDDEPEYELLRNNELAFAVEVDMVNLKNQQKNEIKKKFLEIILGALKKIAHKYNVPYDIGLSTQ